MSCEKPLPFAEKTAGKLPTVLVAVAVGFAAGGVVALPTPVEGVVAVPLTVPEPVAPGVPADDGLGAARPMALSDASLDEPETM